MKKNLFYFLFIFYNLITCVSYGQGGVDYPQIKTDEFGNKIFVLSIEQAQKIDFKLELLNLLEKQIVDCDSLNSVYYLIINNLNNQIELLETNNILFDNKIKYKDEQINLLEKMLENEKRMNVLCEEKSKNYDDEIKILKKELRKQKIEKTLGFILSGVSIVSLVVLIIAL